MATQRWWASLALVFALSSQDYAKGAPAVAFIETLGDVDDRGDGRGPEGDLWVPSPLWLRVLSPVPNVTYIQEPEHIHTSIDLEYIPGMGPPVSSEATFCARLLRVLGPAAAAKPRRALVEEQCGAVAHGAEMPTYAVRGRPPGPYELEVTLVDPTHHFRNFERVPFAVGAAAFQATVLER